MASPECGVLAYWVTEGEAEKLAQTWDVGAWIFDVHAGDGLSVGGSFRVRDPECRRGRVVDLSFEFHEILAP